MTTGSLVIGPGCEYNKAMPPILKFIISALIITAVSEISKRSTMLGALFVSLPLISILSLIWVYSDATGDDTMTPGGVADRISTLSMGVFWLVLPSLVMFPVLAVLIRRGMAFPVSLGISIVAMVAAYGGMLLVLRHFDIGL